jgi:hypothetical protein
LQRKYAARHRNGLGQPSRDSLRLPRDNPRHRGTASRRPKTATGKSRPTPHRTAFVREHLRPILFRPLALLTVESCGCVATCRRCRPPLRPALPSIYVFDISAPPSVWPSAVPLRRPCPASRQCLRRSAIQSGSASAHGQQDGTRVAGGVVARLP